MWEFLILVFLWLHWKDFIEIVLPLYFDMHLRSYHRWSMYWVFDLLEAQSLRHSWKTHFPSRKLLTDKHLNVDAVHDWGWGTGIEGKTRRERENHIQGLHNWSRVWAHQGDGHYITTSCENTWQELHTISHWTFLWCGSHNVLPLWALLLYSPLYSWWASIKCFPLPSTNSSNQVHCFPFDPKRDSEFESKTNFN